MQLCLLTQVSKLHDVYFYENVDVDLYHLFYNVKKTKMMYQLMKNEMNTFNYKEILHSLCMYERT
jgi:hypothetical protein